MPEAVMGTFLLTMLLILCLPTDQEQMAFYGLFLSSGYTQFAKLLLLGSCFAVFLMSYDQLHKELYYLLSGIPLQTRHSWF